MNRIIPSLFALLVALLLAGCASTSDLGLNQAAQAGDTARVQQMLDQGADINREVLPYSFTPLMCAAWYGKANVVEQLLSKGVDINAQNQMGWTALMQAAFAGRTECVKILLAHNPTLEARNDRGQTALDLAKVGGQPKTAALIEAASRTGGLTGTPSSDPATLTPPAGAAAPF